MHFPDTTGYCTRYCTINMGTTGGGGGGWGGFLTQLDIVITYTCKLQLGEGGIQATDNPMFSLQMSLFQTCTCTFKLELRNKSIAIW